MGYQQGLSGLLGAQNDLDVIGNNIANANTTGFKQSTANFEDLFANSIATASNTQIGIGTELQGVEQDFSQGGITTTDQALDVAINGNGFFQLTSSNGSTTFSRDGAFTLNNQGFIVNGNNQQLMGFAANAGGVLNTATTVPLQISNADLPPVATTSITASLNLNSQDAVPTDTPFSATDPNSFNFATSVDTFDSLGGTQEVDLFFVKGTAPGTWEAFGGVKGTAPTDLGTLNFSTSGVLTSTTTGAPPGVPTAVTGQFTLPITTTDGSATPQPLTVSFAGTTQFGGSDGVNTLTQNGFATGTLTNFTVGADGVLTGNYSNGETNTIGQIALATFADPNGLTDIGGNNFVQTAQSGVPEVSVPGSTNHGALTGDALESSNVDLTNSLVDLITAQRNFQANSQTIKTQQTVDQTLINL